MVASIFYEPLGIVLTQSNQRLLRPFLWQVAQITKLGRDAEGEEARQYHMVRGAEMSGQYYQNFDFLWSEWPTYTNFRIELIEKMKASRVIQELFRKYRYDPSHMFCRIIQIKNLWEIQDRSFESDEVGPLLQCDDCTLEKIHEAQTHMAQYRTIT